MRTREKPVSVGGERASKRNRQYFNQPYSSTTRKKFKFKLHWSRRQEQRELDRALLATVGLRFEPVGNTSFSIFSGKGA